MMNIHLALNFHCIYNASVHGVDTQQTPWEENVSSLNTHTVA